MDNNYLFHYKIGIVYTDIDWASNLVNNFIKNINKNSIVRYRVGKHNLELVLNTGLHIIGIPGTESLRGRALDKAIVQNTVSQDFIYKVILPICKNTRCINEEGQPI